MTIEKRYFTTKEAMKYTGMGETSLDYMMRNAIIQAQPCERKYYDKHDIDSRMSERKEKHNANRRAY